jgi:hypothetical protein
MEFPDGFTGGVLVVKDRQVRVYQVGSRTRYITLSPCPKGIVSAVWTGNAIQVNMNDGKTRVYYSKNYYKNIR